MSETTYFAMNEAPIYNHYRLTQDRDSSSGLRLYEVIPQLSQFIPAKKIIFVPDNYWELAKNNLNANKDLKGEDIFPLTCLGSPDEAFNQIEALRPL